MSPIARVRTEIFTAKSPPSQEGIRRWLNCSICPEHSQRPKEAAEEQSTVVVLSEAMDLALRILLKMPTARAFPTLRMAVSMLPSVGV
jgi:hypothetical protein